jgi:hypothetical protein
MTKPPTMLLRLDPTTMRALDEAVQLHQCSREEIVRSAVRVMLADLFILPKDAKPADFRRGRRNNRPKAAPRPPEACSPPRAADPAEGAEN